jgi:ATP-dependent Lon protease
MVEIPKKILSDLKFILVDHMDEVVAEALRPAKPVRRAVARRASVKKKPASKR